MRRKLEDIRIASPCPTRWENMIGDDRVRFCDICAKNVYNISAMTRHEAQTMINDRSDLCALIFMRKDGTVMTADCPVGLAAIRRRVAKRVSLVAGVLLSLVAGMGTFVYKTFFDELPVTFVEPKPHVTPQPSYANEVDKEVLVSLGYVQ